MPILKFFTGPMFAGKTTALLKEYEAYSGGKLIFAPEIMPSAYETHDGHKVTPWRFKSALEIPEELQSIPTVKGVFIDEAQFFGEELPTAVSKLLQRGLDVFIAGLYTDYKRDIWPAMEALLKMPGADVQFLFAKCHYCKGTAQYSYRIALESDQVLLGAEDAYRPVCGDCFAAMDELKKYVLEKKALDKKSRKD